MQGTRTPPVVHPPPTRSVAHLVKLGPGKPVPPRANLAPSAPRPALRTTRPLPRPATTAPTPVPRAQALGSRGPAPPRQRRWIVRHKALSDVALLALLGASAGIAALLIRQDVATSPSTTAPDVQFLTGTDYATINAAGFATVTLGSSGASATLALSGVSGAALVTLGDVMKLQNTDASVAYDVSLARSAVLNAAITSFVVTIKDGGSTLLTWDAVTDASSGSFNLDVSKTLDISVALVVTDGTAAGALGSFSMQFSLTPA